MRPGRALSLRFCGGARTHNVTNQMNMTFNVSTIIEDLVIDHNFCTGDIMIILVKPV